MELKFLPDVAGEKPVGLGPEKTMTLSTGLQWVGMGAISLPVRVQDRSLPALVSAHVNLKPQASRGIHMSRIYRLVSQRLSEEILGEETLNWGLLVALVQDFIESQSGISDQGRIRLQMQWPLLRPSLRSEIQAWRLYPVEMEVQIQSSSEVFLSLVSEILYSSTCPASTALSREVWKESVRERFPSSSSVEVRSLMEWIDGQPGMPATPHAQRSRARVRITFRPQHTFSPEELIKGLEMTLATPVQTFVKRVDEQEFAKLNGQNPMFCEDAARRVQGWLESLPGIVGYHGFFEHQESLHAHNAVAEISR